jgi:hypothetical protein|nr:MAG TPA: hypothetical protein [Ackermannviridae sp.]
MKKIIRLTESDISNIVKNSLVRYLNEEIGDDEINNNYEPFDSEENEEDDDYNIENS